VIFSISLLCFISFSVIACLRTSFLTLDIAINSWTASIQYSPLTITATMLHYLFDTIPMFVICLLLAAYLFLKKRRLYALFLVSAMLGELGILTLAKTLFHVARPLNGIIQEDGFSFPSGHVTSTTVFFGFWMYCIWQNYKSSITKVIASIFFVAIVLAVGFSRLYLNVHWFTDVMGGYFLGLGWILLVIWLFSAFGKSKVRGTQVTN
jgi:undecaprenyl-diphosphatase